MLTNSTNINKTNNHMSSLLNPQSTKKDYDISTLEIQVLV